MAQPLTEEEVKKARAKYGITPFTGANSSTAPSGETAAQVIKRVKAEIPGERENVLATITKDLAKPFARVGVGAYNLVSGLGNLATAGVAKIAGNDQMAGEYVRKAGEEAQKVRNIPFLGDVKGVGSSDDFATNVKDVAGTGAQIAATIAGGGGAKTAASAGLRTAIKEGTKAGLRYGAATGGVYEGGKALQEDEASALDVLQRTLIGTAIGGVGGAAFGAAAPIVGKGVKAVREGVRTAIDTTKEVAEKYRTPLETIVKGVGTNIKSKMQGGSNLVEKTKLNTELKQAALDNFNKLPDDAKKAVSFGVEPKHVEVIKAATPSDKAVFKKIVDAADDQTGKTRPAAVLGEEYRKRLESLRSISDDTNKELSGIVQGLGNTAVDPTVTVSNVVKRLQEVPKLAGIKITPNGQLNFADTTLSGVGSKNARKELQQVFNDIVKRARDPKRMHLYRQELFEDLGGRKAGGIKLTSSEQEAVNAMRRGMSDAIGSVAPKYNEVNTKVAKLIDLQKQIQKKFGEITDGKEDIFDVKSSVLLRRLNQNSNTGQDIAALLRDIDTALGENGVKFDTNLNSVQDFLAILGNYYDNVEPELSFLNLQRNAIRTTIGRKEILQRLADMVGENFQANDQTAKAAIRELLGGTAEQAGKSFSTPEVAKIPLYHGSDAADLIREQGFKLGEVSARDLKVAANQDQLGRGVYFASKPEDAKMYARSWDIADVIQAEVPEGTKIKQFANYQDWLDYVEKRNPKAVGNPEELTKLFQKEGYDGVNLAGDTVIFDPKKVKIVN